MAYNQMFTLRDNLGIELKVIPVALNLDKDIYMLHIFEENLEVKKKYIRNELVLVGTNILTSTFSDTVHLMEELSLFDYGNDQNKYLSVTDYKATKNLKLKYDGNKDIFISKSEARAMYKIFNLAFMGYSVSTVLEKELRFTPQLLTKILHENRFLLK